MEKQPDPQSEESKTPSGKFRMEKNEILSDLFIKDK
jgi:hypothetical protein